MSVVMNLIPEADYKDACDAIREKDGTTALIKSGEMGAKIRAIPSGSGDYEAMFNGIITKTITEARSDKVTFIGGHAFALCKKLTVADFPLATTVESYGFNTCSSLTTINLPLITRIKAYAFGSCSSLTDINFPLLTRVESGAFFDCSGLATVDLPMVTTIMRDAFIYCSALKTLRLSGTTLCNAEGDPSLNSSCKIYVPASLINQYKVANNWSKYASQFVAIEGI